MSEIYFYICMSTLQKTSEYFPKPYQHSNGNVKAELDWFKYADNAAKKIVYDQSITRVNIHVSRHEIYVKIANHDEYVTNPEFN